MSGASDAVRKLRENSESGPVVLNFNVREETPPTAVPTPALGFSLQVDLGAGRVCTLQTFVPNDASLRDLNLMLDKLTAAGDRQRAHYRLEELRRELAKEEKTLSQHQRDLADVDVRHQEAQKRREADIERQTATLNNFERTAAAKHADRGGRDKWEPKGKDLQNVNTINSGIKATAHAILDANAEREKVLANSQITIDAQTKHIERIRAEIDECEAKIAAGLKG